MGGVLVRLFVFVCSPLLKHVAYISVAASSCERPSFTFFSQFAKLRILVNADLSVRIPYIPRRDYRRIFNF